MFSIFRRNQKGFTLIELMIVVVIVGILAALAVPRFMRVSTKSKQVEAKQMLKQLYSMERQYRLDHTSYWGAGVTGSAVAPTAFEGIMVEIMPSAIYTYTINTADDTDLLVTATCGILDDDDDVDTWTIDEGGNLICVSNDADF
ncbi:MAG: prepilin-type N-terminal cleavage/methylation domain-containing protein [candidate division Zixibacteria bacterium]